MHNKPGIRLEVGFLAACLLQTLTFTLLSSIWFTSYVCLFYSAKLRDGPLGYHVPQMLSSDFYHSCICCLASARAAHWGNLSYDYFPTCTFCVSFSLTATFILLTGSELYLLWLHLYFVSLQRLSLGLERVEGDKIVVLSARCTFELLSPFCQLAEYSYPSSVCVCVCVWGCECVLSWGCVSALSSVSFTSNMQVCDFFFFSFYYIHSTPQSHTTEVKSSETDAFVRAD